MGLHAADTFDVSLDNPALPNQPLLTLASPTHTCPACTARHIYWLFRDYSRAGTNIDATPTYPASYNNSNILSVIATDQANRLANYSNYGHHNADIAAPGSQILSTILHGQVCPTCDSEVCIEKQTIDRLAKGRCTVYSYSASWHSS